MSDSEQCNFCGGMTKVEKIHYRAPNASTATIAPFCVFCRNTGTTLLERMEPECVLAKHVNTMMNLLVEVLKDQSRE